MKIKHLFTVLRPFLILISLFFFHSLAAQGQISPQKKQNDFWKKMQYGGGLGLSIGSGYTDITISPSAIYNISPIVAVGTSLQFGYVAAKNDYSSILYGASAIGLINPIPEIQLSVELEETNINTHYKYLGSPTISDSHWNTALYLGAGYRTGNVTVGVRYDILFKENNGYYSDAFMPFVRAYF